MACFFTRGGSIFSIQPQHSDRPALRILLYSAQTIFSSTDNAGEEWKATDNPSNQHSIVQCIVPPCGVRSAFLRFLQFKLI